MSNKFNILLLSSPPEFAKALKNDGHQIRTSELNSDDFFASFFCPRDDTPAYEYDLIICSPHGSISRKQISATAEPVNSLGRAVFQGQTIVVVFLNQAEYEIEPPSLSSIVSNIPEDKRDNSRLAIEKICQRFYPHIVIGYAKNNKTAFANNLVSKELEPVLEPFTKKGIPQFPWSPLSISDKSEQFKPGYRDWKSEVYYVPSQPFPILVNRIEEPHALWIQGGQVWIQDQGGYLFLPEFQDNLAVLRALLNMPITELPEIANRAEMAGIKQMAEFEKMVKEKRKMLADRTDVETPAEINPPTVEKNKQKQGDSSVTDHQKTTDSTPESPAENEPTAETNSRQKDADFYKVTIGKGICNIGKSVQLLTDIIADTNREGVACEERTYKSFRRFFREKGYTEMLEQFDYDKRTQKLSTKIPVGRLFLEKQ